MNSLRCGLCLILGCLATQTIAGGAWDAKPATPETIAAQQRALAAMPEETGRDEKWAQQGFIATLDDPVARAANGDIVFDATAFDWIDGDAPDSVHPDLWRQMKLLRLHGLFKVTDNVWQLRGLDGSNMTIVRGETGWIVIDTMMTTETAANAMQLVDRHLGKRPITGLMFSHTHVDHHGGVYGVLGEQKELPPVIAPEHFLEETGSEWVMAGNAMTRRASFQFAMGLPRNPKGFVGAGLATKPAVGTIRLIPPTDIITKTGDTRVVDGVTFEFQMVPETEAVAEFNVYIPSERVFYISEFATATMHNLQTPRGAQVRDGRQWARFLTEALDLYGPRTDALIFGHTWPRFGNSEVQHFIKLQRDNYKFIHDQTVRMMNRGMTPLEIADTIEPSQGIAAEWSTHGYYGSYRHNAKGVYQYYIGWWDGIPANLNLHTQQNRGERYVDAIGGEERLLEISQRAFEQGDYRWSAELLNHLVFAQPDNDKGRALLADSYEQLGYQALSANFRNIYLTGAAELRGNTPYKNWLASPDIANNISTASFVDLLATRLNPAVFGDDATTVAMRLTDTDENVLITVSNGVLVGEVGKSSDDADVHLSGTRNTVRRFFLAQAPLNKMKQAGLTVNGNTEALLNLQRACEMPPTDYAIVTP